VKHVGGPIAIHIKVLFQHFPGGTKENNKKVRMPGQRLNVWYETAVKPIDPSKPKLV
jgi:hypothetical protein